jgi:hypothetical protein
MGREFGVAEKIEVGSYPVDQTELEREVEENGKVG